jgi:hypothetical protein
MPLALLFVIPEGNLRFPDASRHRRTQAHRKILCVMQRSHESEGHGFSRAADNPIAASSALPKAGVKRSGTTELPSSPPQHTSRKPTYRY